MEPHAVHRRHPAMRTSLTFRLAPAGLMLLVALVAGACGAAGTPSSPGTSSSPGAPSAAPVSEIRTAEQAAAAVAATSPLFDGIERLDPDLIGQGEFWEATPRDGSDPPSGWTVTYQVGWGDCQAGCINRHTWTYEVDRDGTVVFVSEEGSPLEGAIMDQRLNASTVTGVGGRVLASPTCPVEQPGDPACAPRPVDDAVLVVSAAGGGAVAQVTTDASGLYRVMLPPGEYTLEAQPVEGLMGTPGPLPFMVRDGVQASLDVPYDTGIR